MNYNNLKKENKETNKSRGKITTLLVSLTIVATGIISLSGLQEKESINNINENDNNISQISLKSTPAADIPDYTQYIDGATAITLEDGITYYITQELINQAQNNGAYSSLYGVPTEAIYQAVSLQELE